MDEGEPILISFAPPFPFIRVRKWDIPPVLVPQIFGSILTQIIVCNSYNFHEISILTLLNLHIYMLSRHCFKTLYEMYEAKHGSKSIL